MARYLLSVYQPVGEPPAPEVLGPISADVAAVNTEMRAAGVWVFGEGLHPTASATVVRAGRDGGGVLLTDGPYLEGKEHLGGFSVIEVDDLDAALHWAGKLAAAIRYLPIEVRPVLAQSQRSCGPGA